MESGLPELLQAPGGLYIRFRGRALYSERSPRSLPEKSAASFVLGQRTLVLCPSPLLGYGLDILLSKLGPGSLILCVEAEPVLFDLAMRSIPGSIRSDPRLQLARLHPDGSLDRPLPDTGRFRRCSLLALSGGYALHRAAYDAFQATLNAEIKREWSNRATLSALGRLWTRNLIRNLPLLASSKPLAELRERARGKPIFLCGAGPSMESDLDLLSRRGEDYFIISVDTALPALSASGIRADAVVCLEAQVHNARDFIGNAPLRSPLIADLSSHPAPLRIASGGLYFVASGFAPIALLDRMRDAGILPEELPALGSVGVAALRIALALRDPSMPLMLSGLDFSFERGKTHARGAAPHAAAIASSRRLSMSGAWRASVRPGARSIEDTLTGKSLITDPALSSYAELFRAEAAPFAPCMRDLRSQGADLGLERRTWVSNQSALSRSSPISRENDPGAALVAAISAIPLDGRRAAEASAVSAFIESELMKLRALRRILSGESQAPEEELFPLLGSLDYLYVHFPDYRGEPVMERHFLARVSVEADSFIPRLERALSRIATS